MIQETIEALLEEENLPKSVVQCMENIQHVLTSEDQTLVKDKCLSLLEPLVENSGLESFLRTQILDLVALFEQM